MTNLQQIFRRPLAKASTVAVAAFFVIALIGFADATYLTVEHYRGVIPPCSVTSGCETVLTSAYSTIMGLPDSLLGSVYYLIMAVAAFLFLESRHGSGTIAAHHYAILKWALLGTVVGFSMSLWFVYLQAFVLHSYCQYCLGSAATSTILFVMAIFMLRRRQAKEDGQAERSPAQTAAQ